MTQKQSSQSKLQTEREKKRVAKKQTREERRLAKQRAKNKRQTLEEKREEILAKGRKFKYPLQYAKYKMVWYTIIVAVLAVAALTGFLWLDLYQWGSTSDMVYRITQVVPVAVASVDGEPVRFSDYLMLYKSSLSVLEKQNGALGSDAEADGLRVGYKRMALDQAEEYAYAGKLARELGISVDTAEIDAYIASQRQVGGTEQTEEAFFRIVESNLGLSASEYRHLVELTLLRNQVKQAVDTEAQALADRAETLVSAGKSLAEVAEELGDAVEYEETGGLVASTNIDGGRAKTALSLAVGKVSERFTADAGDGIYLVQLVEKTDTQVNYRSLKIPFSEFDTRLQTLRDGDGVTEEIEINTGE